MTSFTTRRGQYFSAMMSAPVRGSILAAAMTLFLSSSPIRADLINISAVNGMVGVSGGVSVPNSGAMTYHDWQPGPTSVSGHADWAPTPSDLTGAGHAFSSAAQSWSMSGVGFSFAQQIFYSLSLPGNVTLGTVAYANAASSFSVSFTVSQAVMYQLSLSGGGNGGGQPFAYSGAFTLNGETLFLGGTYSGLFLPGETYDFSASQQLVTVPDVLGGAGFGNANVQMQLSSVPESGGFLCLVLGALALGMFQWTLRRDIIPKRRQCRDTGWRP